MDATAIAKAEKAYGITLTDYEKSLLESAKASLSPIERQVQFLLVVALGSQQCPRCLGTICQRSAATVLDEEKGLAFAGSQPDDAYKCPLCDTRLVWHLGLIGGNWFTIHPGEALKPAAKG
jgi:hypothetical protein